MSIKERHREALRTLTEIVVDLVGDVSGISFAVLGRGVRGLLPPHALLSEALFRRNLSRAVKRAERRGLVAVFPRRNKPPIIRVTRKGQMLLARRTLVEATADRPRRWDGKWRIVMFDVPEKQRRARNAIRSTLQQLGFCRLQQSVWLYPFDCRDLVTLIRTAYGMEHVTVRYLVVHELEEDAAFRRHFDV